MPGSTRNRVSRPLLAVIILILLPGLALGYFGFRALAEKENSLRTNYTATTVLVRDRLAAELTRVESDLGNDLTKSAVSLDNPTATANWLATLSAQRPWFDQPFLLRADAAVMMASVRADWPRASGDPPAAPPRLAAAIRAAETAEFVQGDLELALRYYRQTLALVPSSLDTHALALTRVGRTLFKLRRFDEAVVQYRAVLALPSDTIDRNGLPYVVIALLQLADSFEALGQRDERARAERQLLQYIVDHPWDLEDGYGHYLAGALASAKPSDVALLTKGRELTHAVAGVEWIRRDVRPRIEPDLRTDTSFSLAFRHVSIERDGRPVLIGCRRLAADSDGPPSAVLGYEIRPDYVRGPMLAEVLKTVDLGHDLRVAVVDSQDRVSREPAASSGSGPLAKADLQPLLPGWQVALFHRQGRSMEQLVARERWIYGTLIVGMVTVMIVGVAFTMRASARATELSRLKSEFVSSVSHELKTPLALIRMFGETLESGIVADEQKRQEFYGIIRRESERLTHLINNVLDIGRIDAGTKQYGFKQADLVETVQEALEAYRPLFDRLGFQIETIFPESPVDLPMDRDAIVQALVNLFQNVIKYSGDRRYASVSIAVRDGAAYVSIGDHGAGIPRDEISRIFERYYRIPTSVPAGSPGSGLGLSIVKHTIEAHGGRVEVESTIGQGSVFTLVLPIRGAASASAHHVAPQTAST